jgi:hypothetical protein
MPYDALSFDDIALRYTCSEGAYHKCPCFVRHKKDEDRSYGELAR